MYCMKLEVNGSVDALNTWNTKPGQSENKAELIKIIFDMVNFISKRTEIIM